MSTGLELQFIEAAEGEWWYLIEDWDAPKMAWDWREYATAHGPFTTEAAAEAHYRANNANTGGSSTTSFRTRWTPDATFAKLKAEALARPQATRSPYRW